MLMILDDQVQLKPSHMTETQWILNIWLIKTYNKHIAKTTYRCVNCILLNNVNPTQLSCH